jgi:hypothetical protein
MARLDSASRLRWPRRIMVSMTSLRNRLAEAPSPSSPPRSRYSQAIWKDSSSNWESEMVMSKKPTRTFCVPCHRRFAPAFLHRPHRLGPKEDVAEHVGLRRLEGIAHREARIPPIASEGVVHGCDLPGLLPGVSCDDGDLAAGPAKVVVRSRRQAKQRPRLADFDCLFGSDLQLSSSAAISPRFSAGAW